MYFLPLWIKYQLNLIAVYVCNMINVKENAVKQQNSPSSEGELEANKRTLKCVPRLPLLHLPGPDRTTWRWQYPLCWESAPPQESPVSVGAWSGWGTSNIQLGSSRKPMCVPDSDLLSSELALLHLLLGRSGLLDRRSLVAPLSVAVEDGGSP